MPIGICMVQYNLFNNLTDKATIRPHLNRLYRTGYENVYKYSEQLEEYLTKNNIRFTIDYEEDYF